MFRNLSGERERRGGEREREGGGEREGEFVCVLTHGILCVQWTKMLGRMLRLCQPLFPSLSRCVCVRARVKDLSDRIEMEDGDHQRKCMSVFNLH